MSGGRTGVVWCGLVWCGVKQNYVSYSLCASMVCITAVVGYPNLEMTD